MVAVVLGCEAFAALADGRSRHDRRMMRYLEAARRLARPVVVPTVVLAEQYRGPARNSFVDACLSRQEQALTLRDTDREPARLVGSVLATADAGSEHLADGHVMAAAIEAGGGVVVTGDRRDLGGWALPTGSSRWNRSDVGSAAAVRPTSSHPPPSRPQDRPVAGSAVVSSGRCRSGEARETMSMTGEGQMANDGSAEEGDVGTAGPGGAEPPPKLLWPLSKVVTVTVATVLLVPAGLLFSGFGSAFIGEYGLRTAVLVAVGGPMWALSYLIPRKLGAGRVLALAVAAVGVLVSVTGLAAAEYHTLSTRGEEVTAQVVERDAAVRTRNYECTLEQADGTAIRPRLGGRDCRDVREGDALDVVFDPEGQVGPVTADKYDNRSADRGLALALAGVQAGLLALAPVRGRPRQRRAAAAWGRPAYLADPGGPEDGRVDAAGAADAPEVVALDDGGTVRYAAREHRLLRVAVVVALGAAVVLGVLGYFGSALVVGAAGLIVGATMLVVVAPAVELSREGVGLRTVPRRRVAWSEVWSIQPVNEGWGELVEVVLTDGTRLRTWGPYDRRHKGMDPDKVAVMQQAHRRYGPAEPAPPPADRAG